MMMWQAVRHVAGPYDMWKATMWTVGSEWDDDMWHYQGEWFGATWHPVIGWLYKIYLESTGFDPVTSTHM
jgi:hypothetical protein